MNSPSEMLRTFPSVSMGTVVTLCSVPVVTFIVVLSWLYLRKKQTVSLSHVPPPTTLAQSSLGQPRITPHITTRLESRVVLPGEKTIQEKLRSGAYDAQGPRESMEDAHTIDLQLVDPTDDEQSCAFLGVYDGHGGRRAADFVAQNLPHKWAEKYSSVPDKGESLREAILQVEEEFLELAQRHEWCDGTTLVVAVIKDNDLAVANVGDSECVICSKGEAFALSEIHNPSKNSDEIRRVQDEGGIILQERLGHPALNANYFNLGISRAIGDDMYKNFKYTQGKPSGLVADPFVTNVSLRFDEDDFLILACDGLWDVLTHQEAVDFVTKQLQITDDLNEISKNLVNEAFIRHSSDNISVIVATWKSFLPE